MIVENQKELIKDIKYEKYSYEDTLKSSIEYFNGDELAATTWMNKYAMKDSENNFVEKTPDDMHKRMAKELGRIESD
jgi:ribonucleoside-diphosphate reductase alpha chain